MKLIRYGVAGQERPGLVAADGSLRDLSAEIGDVGGEFLAPRVMRRLRELDPQRLPLVEAGARLGPCVAGTSNFLAIGLNYRDHAHEIGAAVPGEPIVFNKAVSCIAGPNDDVPLPAGSTATDWECELAIVISQDCYEIEPSQAREFIAGYCVCHDISERKFQLEHGGQWVKGKSFPGFGPLGPWLVDVDSVPDATALSMWLRVNDETVQSSNTRQMIFTPDQLVAYLSRLMLLRAGDIITTGTPSGVGMSRKPPRFLRSGDRVSLGIEGLGTQQHQFVSRAR
ncbi:fumarylacetoacetate hydrolase family protein [Peristeroidobacter soli]|jgi:2-keto-4-pentenoate hydratase/2-oxohepta-3-ene-1,7-dioic acid hydratase in catechol pathway|uniref:fumarylacetoacetate hydrolase family protein n=1 Tax=Peristeroidobacter soli TaxID=2497877 RepID=UPI00101D80CA|nr:fumarylacetoacetate hydrolase family protein [Peristeroidobacter soli]